jgi:hypothetical protein
LCGFDVRLLAFGFFQVDGGVVDVVAGVFEDEFAVFVAEGAADFAGDTGDQRVGRDLGVFGQDGSGGDDGALADAAVVEDSAAHADEAGVFDGASVDGCVVADGDPVAEGDGVDVAHAVEDGAVLDVGVSADADAVDVAADDGIHPDAGVFTEDDIANDLGRQVDVAGGGDCGKDSLIGPNHLLFILLGQMCVHDLARIFSRLDAVLCRQQM